MTIGFSVRKDIVNKATPEQAVTLHKDWRWIPNGTPHRLMKAITNGYAVTPARWADSVNRNGVPIAGYKSKFNGEFIEASYVLLDFDGELSLEAALKDPFITSTAAFLYTSPSHRKPGKGDRFRVVWVLSAPVTSWREHDDVILYLREKVGRRDDDKINSASCLFGSKPSDDNFFCHIWNGYRNRVDPKPIIEQQQALRVKRLMEREANGCVDGDLWAYDKDACGEDRVALMVHCLKMQADGYRYVPERAGKGTNTYNYAWDALAGLVHYFGADLTMNILEQADWYGEPDSSWCVERIIEELAIREENWEPGMDWKSYNTVLKIARQHIVDINSKQLISPSMPIEDLSKFKYDDRSQALSLLTADTEVILSAPADMVSVNEAESYQDMINEIVRLELSDYYNDNVKATLLISKVCKNFNVPPITLKSDVYKAATHIMGIDLHGDRSSINVDPNESGWDFSDDSEDAMEYLIPGVLPKLGTTAIAGVGGSGKNKITAYYGFRVVEGLPCIPHPEIPMEPLGKKILIIATDQAGNATKRIANDFRDAGATNEWLQKNVKIVSANPKTGSPAWTATLKGLFKLKQLMDSEEFGLVIVDSLKTITAGTQFCMTDNNDMSLLTRALMLIVNPHASMLIINHAGDPSTKKVPNINEMQTATAFGQMVDAVFILRIPVDNGHYREMYGVKIRDNNHGTRISYTFNPDTGDLELLDNSLSPEAKRIDEIIESIANKEPIKGNPAAAGASYIAKDIGMDVRQVSNYLTKLNSMRLVRRKGTGYLVTALGHRHLEHLKSNHFVFPVAEERDF